jgi:hypothetical protein
VLILPAHMISQDITKRRWTALDDFFQLDSHRIAIGWESLRQATSCAHRGQPILTARKTDCQLGAPADSHHNVLTDRPADVRISPSTVVRLVEIRNKEKGWHPHCWPREGIGKGHCARLSAERRDRLNPVIFADYDRCISVLRKFIRNTKRVLSKKTEDNSPF